MLNEDIHPHCLTCIKFLKCTVVPKEGESCKIITCPSFCGAKFHECKGREHKLLCLNEKVPCINAGYGCPVTLYRRHLSKHLVSCPASIVHCSHVWDRWPIHLHDKKMFMSSSQLDPELRSDLDVALALRDRRMLREHCIAVSQGRVGHNEKIVINASSSLWIYRKWNSSGEFTYPSGLRQSLCRPNRAFNPDCVYTRPHFYSPHTDPRPNFICNNAFIGRFLNSEVYNSNETSNKENEGDVYNKILEVIPTCKSKYVLCNHNCEEIKDRCLYTVDEVLQLNHLGTLVYHLNGREGSVYVPIDSAESLTQLCNGSTNSACQILDLKFRNPTSTPPWCVSLGLDLNVEARSQHSSSNFMYTFLCGQEFRRDEYTWHFKNVHSEIQGGLNGWLLERCPLAQYGCKFSRTKFKPALENSYIVYNETQEGYGLAFTLEESDRNNSEQLCDQIDSLPSLCDLPIEVLLHIVEFLDSFSLANLSLTSSLLRDVCGSVLRKKGLVHFKWERHRTNDNKITWKTSPQARWFFSPHFTPVSSWTMEDGNLISNHLKVCPFFNRNSPKQAFAYGEPKNRHPSPLDKRFDDPSKEEHKTTKL